MRIHTRLLFVASLVFVGPADAQKAPPAPPTAPSAQPKAATPEPPVTAKIEALAWMKGYWTGEGYGGTVETMMSPARSGVMIGTFRQMKDGKPGFYEVCAIEEHEGSLRFVVKHFHPNWVGWEEKDRALQARLVRVGKDEWQFSNMLIKRTGRDAFTIEIMIQPRDAPPRKEILRFRRQPL
jgi:hypothetical protein